MIRTHFLIATAMLSLAGCGGGTTPLPSTTQAREAVQAALVAWKNGKPASDLAQATPAVAPVDFEWSAGKTLSDFTIGAEENVQGTKSFAVKLTLAPSEVKETRYMVLGESPFRVFREEDFQRMLNMEDGPADPSAKKKAGAKPRR